MRLRAAALLPVIALACTTAKRQQPRATLLFEYGAPAIQLIAPEGYRIESSMGPDFSVHYLLPANGKVEDKRGIGVYAGNYPSRRSDRESGTRAQSPGRIANKEIVWTCRRTMCETIVSDLVAEPKRPNPTVLHVWVTGKDDAEVARYLRLAESQIVSVQ